MNIQYRGVRPVLRSRLVALGFTVVEDLGSAELNARYFARRKDGLQSAGGGFRVAYAEV
jgi:hypothetical protein